MIQKRITEREPRLAEFIEGFIECALWASTTWEGEPLDRDYCAEDLSESALVAIERECRDFFTANESMIEDNEANAGHDFFLTRNGHGAGFWDGDWGDYGDVLTENSEAYGSFDLYVGDDNRIWAYGYESEES